MKNIGLACKAFEARKNKYPQAAFFGNDDAFMASGTGYGSTTTLNSSPESGTAAAYPYSFFCELLQDLDAAYIANQIDYTNGPFNSTASTTKFQLDGTTGRKNSDTCGQPIPILNCPSASERFAPTSGTGAIYSAGTNGSGPALTNYKPVAATNKVVLLDNTSNTIGTPVATSGKAGGTPGEGLISPYGENRPDSQSLTLLMAETAEENLAAWADGGTIAIWGSDASLAPDINNSIADRSSGNSTNAYEASFNGNSMQQGVSSAHPNTVNIVLGDGSARTISDDIDGQAWNAFITIDGNDNSFASQYIAGQQ